MQPQDWPCRVSQATALATYLGGSLLIWLALPGMILAAAGRRLWAVLPATVAVMGLFAGTVVSWVTQTSGGHSFFGIDASSGIGPAGSFWTRHSAGAVLFDLVLAYAGFVAAQGHAVTPAIAWVDGTPQGVDVVGLTQASDDMAEVVALSGSGAAFCVRSLVRPSGTAVTYGTGTDASCGPSRLRVHSLDRSGNDVSTFRYLVRRRG
jgi:hypothetical protein